MQLFYLNSVINTFNDNYQTKGWSSKSAVMPEDKDATPVNAPTPLLYTTRRMLSLSNGAVSVMPLTKLTSASQEESG